MAPPAGYDRAAVAEFPTVRVAALQATPVILDLDASLAKAERLLADAAADGVRLAVLPETYLSLYPSNAWAHQASTFGGSDELWERMWESSVEVPGPVVDRFAEACREHGLVCAIGVNEREAGRPGTLYNALLLIGPEGLIWKHRKLMPTHHERLFHGIGAGDDLDVADTPVGRVGGPLYGEEGMVVADCDLRRGLHAKRWFDAVGHYGRTDVLTTPLGEPGSLGAPP